MKQLRKAAIASTAALALAGVGIVAGVTGASAYTGTPAWETGNTLFSSALNYPNLDQNSKGGIIFYDSSGNVITGGTNLSNLAAYVSTTGTAARTNANLANVIFGVPDHTKANSLTWATFSGSASTSFPVGSPSNLAALGTTVPVVTLGSSDVNLTNLLGVASLDSSAGYANVIQVRVKDGGIGLASTGVNSPNYFWSTDIEYNNGGSALSDGLAPGNWQVIYPAAVIRTTTVATPTASPASPQYAGTSVTFSTSVTAATGTNPASGSVQFYDGGVALGAAQTITSAGQTLGVTTSALSESGAFTNHTITAAFTPAAFSDLGSSTSSALTFRVNHTAAAATVTTLGNITSVDGTGTVNQPDAFSVTAVVTVGGSPLTAGTVALFDNGVQIGLTAASSPFTFNVSSSSLTVATHSNIYAVFTPTDALTYQSSQSSAASLVVALPAYTPAVAGIETTIQPGTITLSTPYSTGSPLVLPDMTIDSNVTNYSTSGQFAGISVLDTRPGNLAYTLSALASNLVKQGIGGSPSNAQQISGENVGLTNLLLTSTNATPSTFLGSLAIGASTTGQNFSAFDNAAGAHLSASDTGSAGLGGVSGHEVLHANSGQGTTVIHGLLSINAPTNTVDGTYLGTLTFTVLGS